MPLTTPVKPGLHIRAGQIHDLDPDQPFHPWPFDKEAEPEATIAEVKAALFGESRICLDVKKLIGAAQHEACRAESPAQL